MAEETQRPTNYDASKLVKIKPAKPEYKWDSKDFSGYFETLKKINEAKSQDDYAKIITDDKDYQKALSDLPGNVYAKQKKHVTGELSSGLEAYLLANRKEASDSADPSKLSKILMSGEASIATPEQASAEYKSVCDNLEMYLRTTGILASIKGKDKEKDSKIADALFLETVDGCSDFAKSLLYFTRDKVLGLRVNYEKKQAEESTTKYGVGKFYSENMFAVYSEVEKKKASLAPVFAKMKAEMPENATKEQQEAVQKKYADELKAIDEANPYNPENYAYLNQNLGKSIFETIQDKKKKEEDEAKKKKAA